MGSSRKKLNGFYIDMGPGEKTTVLLGHFLYENDHFTTTGSGQTSEKLKKSIVVLTGFQCNGKQVFQRKLYQGDDSKTLFVLFQPDGHTHWVIGRPERVWDCENRGFINSPKDSCPLSVRKNCPLLRLAVFLSRTKEKPIVCQDRLGTNIRKLNKNGPFSRTTTQPDQSECSSRWLENRGKEKKKAVLEVRKKNDAFVRPLFAFQRRSVYQDRLGTKIIGKTTQKRAPPSVHLCNAMHAGRQVLDSDGS